MRMVALVTGAARGIGLGIARRLACEGYDLAIGDIQEEATVGDTLSSLRGQGAEVLYCRTDIGAPEDRKQLVRQVQERYGRLHLLVNNAGVAPRERKDLLEATEESFEWVLRVNLQGPYFLTQAVANWMIEQRKASGEYTGCIINISSISASVASINRGEYCISKAGVSMSTSLWAIRLAEFGIPVYEVRPGIIKTDMTAGVRAKYDKLIAEGILLQARWGMPEDVAKAVALLAHGDLAYSTGQVIMVDGGFSVQRL
ncbi:MAG TPA: 3-ketoacyl-ACP reductase [Acidobacteriota bacterium]|nr:3-ketoacyl-ACP reductase [Acidobacteriota bacterium]